MRAAHAQTPTRAVCHRRHRSAYTACMHAQYSKTIWSHSCCALCVCVCVCLSMRVCVGVVIPAPAMAYLSRPSDSRGVASRCSSRQGRRMRRGECLVCFHIHVHSTCGLALGYVWQGFGIPALCLYLYLFVTDTPYTWGGTGLPLQQPLLLWLLVDTRVYLHV